MAHQFRNSVAFLVSVLCLISFNEICGKPNSFKYQPTLIRTKRQFDSPFDSNPVKPTRPWNSDLNNVESISSYTDSGSNGPGNNNPSYPMNLNQPTNTEAPPYRPSYRPPYPGQPFNHGSSSGNGNGPQNDNCEYGCNQGSCWYECMDQTNEGNFFSSSKRHGSRTTGCRTDSQCQNIDF